MSAGHTGPHSPGETSAPTYRAGVLIVEAGLLLDADGRYASPLPAEVEN